MKINIVFIYFLIFLAFSFNVNASEDFVTIKERNLISDHDGEINNWRTDSPTVILAFAFKEDNITRQYTDFVKRELRSGIQLKAIYNSTQGDIVQALRSTDTVAFIAIGHTFQDKNLHSSVWLDANMRTLPNEIISASLPSLRFFSLLGCHGNGLPIQYQAEYEINKLPGRQEFYYPTEKLLTSKKLIIFDGIKKNLRRILIQINNFDFNLGLNPEEPTEELNLFVQDVVARIEPRFVMINKKIIGMLGDTSDNSNQDELSKKIIYKVYPFELKLLEKKKIEIRGSDVSPRILADDYIINSIELNGSINKNLEVQAHIGQFTNMSEILNSIKQAKENLIKNGHESILNQIIDPWFIKDYTQWPELKSRVFKTEI